ncbi:MAG TPA: 50S ribosomal protein L25 [Candidatus Saccharimonadales bacterium]|nr:50S ribosomal protein L25 [Candidatus Saccharimonadales bacterium]
MKTVPLNAYPRSMTRRPGSKKLRSQGRVPAVVYGRELKPQNLEVNRVELENLIKHSVSENLLLDLSVSEDARPKRLVLVQDIQHNPLTGSLVHIDLHEVRETEKVTVMVPVETKGEAAGVKNGGGVLEHVLFKIKVRALPKDLPEVIEVDVTSLEIGKAIHLGEIKAPEGVEILGDKHISVIAVAAPITEAQEAAATAEAAGAGEVEMTKEKKEEGAAGAAPAAKAGEKAPAGKAAAPEKGAEKGAEKAGDAKAEKKK